jgi:hypothetical protein
LPLRKDSGIVQDMDKPETVTTIRPLGPAVVFAPPAFKGQKSSGTKARFQMIAERLKAANTVKEGK